MSHSGLVAIAGCKSTTEELILGLLNIGVHPSLCITIDPEKGRSQSVSGYVDLRPFLDQHKVEWYVADKYSLKSEVDRRALSAIPIDALLVIGWQRLIPEWLLEHVRFGAYGMHGSNKPLPHGRGRSPLNWSLIQDKRLFFTNLFRYSADVDDGPIVGTQVFDITVFDTAHTLHLKNLISMTRLCEKHLPAILSGTVTTRPQALASPSYYPKREPDDGLIDWNAASTDIYNLVRAVTRPFPGAFSFFDRGGRDDRLTIWRGVPFDSHLTYPDAEPGEIIRVFTTGEVLVKTGDTSFLVQEYDGVRLDVGQAPRRFSNGGMHHRHFGELPT